jgi:integrase
VNIELRTLRAAFYTAQRWKMIEENPLRKVALCRIEEKAPCFLSLGEFRELHSAVKEEWLRDMMVLAALSGMRRGEILNLRWEQVDPRNGLITVQSSADFKTKGGKKRVIPMNKCLVEMFERRLRQNGEEFVFAVEGRKISRWWVSRKFKRYVLKLGLDDKLHFHSLRHSFATWLVQDGASIYEVQKLLGHSSIKTTEIYSHLVPDGLRRTVDRISVELN